MAWAIIGGVLRSRLLPGGAMIVSEPLAGRREEIRSQLGVECTADNAAPARAPRVLLAVKPQVLDAVLAEIAPVLSNRTLVISIVAGIKTSKIDKSLGGKCRIVRVMPNTPMLVGAGMSAVAGGPRAGADDLAWTQRLFASAGEVCLVDEKDLDAVTAVSGSGPAYFFYMVEAMTQAGIEEGLAPEVAEKLARMTCLGAGRLLAESSEPAELLRRKVTSPGGTTQAAVESLESAKVRQALVQACRQAARRSRELSGYEKIYFY